MGSLTCHAAMIAHVSPLVSNYSETLTTIQLASRIHRMRRKRFKFMGANAACGGEEGAKATGSSDVDPSSSEQSADTVIYVGPSEETDGEHPPVYIPSLNSGDNRCAMNKALRGSLVEQKLKSASRSVPASPQRSIPEEKASRKIPKPVSTRSSPARKAPEEQWVDGPKILKSRVSEARNIHRGREKRETWVDGPKGYGFMDTHKKNMIRQWVENQTAIVTRHHERPRQVTQPDRPSPSFPVSKVVPLEKLQCTGVEPEYIDDEEMEIEIIEIEEPMEPVPMQDCCLQVTEEDIALCMGELENPLPEVDQRAHPLRILSQENLTVVSTFADSMSVVNDFEKLIPRNGSLYKEMNEWQQRIESPVDLIARKCNYEQLSALQDLYQMRKAEMKPVSRCQSLMFSDFITGPPSDVDVNSIASEPAYLPGENGKFCDNCKGNLEQNDEMKMPWQKQDMTRFHGLRKFTSISSLRHPDGASNPNLRDICSREPGNGAESMDRKDDEEEIAVPPPLQSSMFTLNRDGYDNTKPLCSNSQELRNSHVQDSGSKGGQYCRADVERLDRGWDETLKSSQRLRHFKRDHKFVKAELTSARHRNLFSPFERGGLLEKRNQIQNITSTSKNKSIFQAF
ncbi:unnamed protein product [Nezara viridula]|uniref:Kinesin motor domain-containing protein n=1 Tax=Nezara viridula TaxID=85310 RepID=A0A9P0HSU0_NEZVI|nr:unnamed protein product [Nezara viridula]